MCSAAKPHSAPIDGGASNLEILDQGFSSSFLNDLVAQECDYTLNGHLTQRAFDELFDAGKFEELHDLVDNCTSISPEIVL
jgi:hypothetical protein